MIQCHQNLDGAHDRSPCILGTLLRGGDMWYMAMIFFILLDTFHNSLSSEIHESDSESLSCIILVGMSM